MQVENQEGGKMSKDVAAKTWEKLNSDVGNMFFRADEPLKFDVDVVDLDSPSLGAAIGLWGLPCSGGKVSELTGAEGSGKSMMSLLICAAIQRKFKKGDVLWIDTENSLNIEWAKQLGVDIKRLRVARENDAAKIWSSLVGYYNKDGKKVKPGVLDLVVSGELDIKFIVLDSIADLVPPVEAGRNAEDQEMAPLARFLPKAFRMLKPMLAKANLGLLCINHLRDSMTGGQSSPGGRHYRHSLDASVRILASNAADATLFNDKKEKVGHRCLATVSKTRYGANKRQAEFWLDFRKGVVKTGEEVALLGAAYGVVQRPNNLVWVYGDKTIKGKDNFFQLLEDDAALRTEILAKAKEAHKSGVDGRMEVVGQDADAANEATEE